MQAPPQCARAVLKAVSAQHFLRCKGRCSVVLLALLSLTPAAPESSHAWGAVVHCWLSIKL